MRDINQAAFDALEADDVIHLVLLAEFDFVEGMQRFWAGPEGHSLSWNGNVYTSISDLGEIDKISEAQGLADSRTVVSLRVNSESVDVIEGADSRGRAANIHLLILEDQAKSVLGNLTFRKTMGALGVSARLSRDGESKVINERITLELLDETSTLTRSHIARMTYEQGLRIDQTDHGLEFVADPNIGDLPGLRDDRVIGLGPHGEIRVSDPATVTGLVPRGSTGTVGDYLDQVLGPGNY